jgi:putative membrane protein
MEFALLPTISTSCIVLSAIFVAIGVWAIKRKDRQTHERMMKLGALFAVLFFLIYLGRTVFVGNTSFGGPDHLKPYYFLFLIFHIVLAILGAVLGIRTLWLAGRERFDSHKKIGPVTSILWFFSAGTGVVVYILLYVLYPGGQTTSLIKAIFGF